MNYSHPGLSFVKPIMLRFLVSFACHKDAEIFASHGLLSRLMSKVLDDDATVAESTCKGPPDFLARYRNSNGILIPSVVLVSLGKEMVWRVPSSNR